MNSPHSSAAQSDRSVPNRTRYQTAPRPEADRTLTAPGAKNQGIGALSDPGRPSRTPTGRVYPRTLANDRRPFSHPSLPGVMVLPLTRGLSALIDADVSEVVGRWNWAVCPQTSDPDTFYATAWVDYRKIKLHRFLWAIWKLPPTPTIDHFDGNTLDYRRSNLRAASYSENTRNNRKLRPGAAERYLAESRALISDRKARRTVAFAQRAA